MTTPASSFAHQDLRDRVFRGQNLRGANFRDCDLRGCDFSRAVLQEATFEQVKVGQTLKSCLIAAATAVIVVVLTANAVSQMVFAALGQTPAEPGWSFVVALIVSLEIAGAAPVPYLLRSPNWMQLLSPMASGALLSFFYAGSAAGNSASIATTAAAIGAVATAVLAWQSIRFRSGGCIAVAIAAIAGVTAYGLAFFVGTYAIACFSTQRLGWGMIWSALSIAYIGLSLLALRDTISAIRRTGVTSFRRADLTNATFAKADLQNADFTGAIGSGWSDRPRI